MDAESLYESELDRVSNIIIGKHIDDVRKLDLTPYNTLRVVKSNGKYCFVTADFRVDRIDVEVEKNIIIKVNGIG